MSRLNTIASCLALLITFSSPAYAAPFFDGITPAEGTAIRFPTPVALSADGRSVVGTFETLDFRDGTRTAEGYVWTREEGYRSFDDIDGLGSAGFRPVGISSDGSRVVGSVGPVPTLWQEGVGTTALVELDASTESTRVTGISDNGAYIIGAAHDGTDSVRLRQTATGGIGQFLVPRYVPVRWNSDGTTMEVLTEIEGTALDVSNNGVVVGDFRPFPQLAHPEAAFRWDEDNGTQLIPLLTSNFRGWSTKANAIAADGTTLGGQTADEQAGLSGLFLSGYLWNGEPVPGDFLPREGLVSIRSPESTSIYRPEIEVFDISADGSVAVGQYADTETALRQPRPFIWSESEGFRDLQTVLVNLGLNLEGWTLQAALKVSADGKTIVGEGFMEIGPPHNFAQRKWIAVIPEPSTGVLVCLGLLGLSGTRRHC